MGSAKPGTKATEKKIYLFGPDGEPVHKTGLTLGRSNFFDRQPGDPDIDAPPSQVGERHAILYPEPAGLRVEDCGWKTGTEVNGVRFTNTAGFIPWDQFPKAKILLGAECFRVMILPITKYKDISGSITRDVYDGGVQVQAFIIMLGRYKSEPDRATVKLIPSVD